MGFATCPLSSSISKSPLSLYLEPRISLFIPFFNPTKDCKILRRKLFSYSSLIQGNNVISYKDSTIAALGAQDSGSGEEEDKRALETVLRLYDAIWNRNKSELSDIIGEECRCVCNFIAAYQPCYGKKQVLDFFTTLMKNLGSNIQFKVQPTLHDGMNVGISWKLEWSKSCVPLGKGFSFYVCHIYQGKAMIRNVEMFMEPLFHLEPLRMKIMGFLMNIIDKVGPSAVFKTKVKRAIHLLLALSLTMTLLFFTSVFCIDI